MAAMAKKKEEWLAKLRGITTTDQNIATPTTLTSNSTAKKKLKLKDVITSSICTIVDRTRCSFFNRLKIMVTSLPLVVRVKLLYIFSTHYIYMFITLLTIGYSLNRIAGLVFRTEAACLFLCRR
jgi:hypothetical protein